MYWKSMEVRQRDVPSGTDNTVHPEIHIKTKHRQSCLYTPIHPSGQVPASRLFQMTIKKRVKKNTSRENRNNNRRRRRRRKETIPRSKLLKRLLLVRVGPASRGGKASTVGVGDTCPAASKSDGPDRSGPGSPASHDGPAGRGGEAQQSAGRHCDQTVRR